MSTPPLSEADMREVLKLREQYGNLQAAADATGRNRNTLSSRYQAARRWQAGRGEIGGPPIPEIGRPPEGFAIARNNAEYDADGNLRRQWVATKRDAGEAFEVPAGHVVKGVSALLDADGRVAARWVKTREGDSEGLIEALERRFSAYAGAAALIPMPVAANDELLTIYPLADLHFGLYAWGQESGDDYDVDIATDLVRKTISSLVAKSEPSRRAVILGLGDLFHQNDQKNATPKSHHQLDVDGRWGRVFEAGARLMTDIVELVAQKHEQVDVVMLPGNHDEDASVCLRVALSLFYQNNARIKVHNKPGLHWFDRFGKCLFGATHGHTMRPDRMALMLANDRPQDWGETVHRSFYFGHIHHETAKEVGNVRVESFSTPAAKDAYAAGGGYRSGRAMSAITFHSTDGEIGRHRVNIAGDWAKVRAAAA
jgi:hypothetical protein